MMTGIQKNGFTPARGISAQNVRLSDSEERTDTGNGADFYTYTAEETPPRFGGQNAPDAFPGNTPLYSGEEKSTEDSAGKPDTDRYSTAASENSGVFIHRGSGERAALFALAAAGVWTGLGGKLLESLTGGQFGEKTAELAGKAAEWFSLPGNFSPDLLKSGLAVGALLLLIGWCGVSALGQPGIFLAVWVGGIAAGSYASGCGEALHAFAEGAPEKLLPLLFPAVELALCLWLGGESLKNSRRVRRMLRGKENAERSFRKHSFLAGVCGKTIAAEILCWGNVGLFMRL